MSYCRWSSEDFKSDFYVYPNVSGAWTIHVAGSKLVGEERISHTLPHAGETFDTASPGDCADKCEELAAIGYHLPAWVVPKLRAEQAEHA